MATTLNSTDPGALIICTSLSLVYSFGIFYKLARLWGKVSEVRTLATSSYSPCPPPHPTPKGPTRQDLLKCSARGLVKPKEAIPFAPDNVISSLTLPKDSAPLTAFLKAQGDPIPKTMSSGPEERLLGFTHVLGHSMPTGLSGQGWPHHNALLLPSKGIGDSALAGPV